MNTYQNEFKATVKEVGPLVDADMGEALGELKYVSVTFAIEGGEKKIWNRLSGRIQRGEFSGDSGLERAHNAAGAGYLARNGVFTASLGQSPQLVEGASFPVKISSVSDFDGLIDQQNRFRRPPVLKARLRPNGALLLCFCISSRLSEGWRSLRSSL